MEIYEKIEKAIELHQQVKIRTSSGDIIIVTLPYSADQTVFAAMREVVTKIFPINDCILLPEGYSIRRESEEDGTHGVYLNNIEFLEYLANKNKAWQNYKRMVY